MIAKLAYLRYNDDIKGVGKMKLVPIGIENFKEIIDKKYYYVDKTELIKDVINDKVALYTRPRRFGKTLNMSMLYYFFSNQEKNNYYLFDGFKITNYPDIMKHQNQYPTLFFSLKDMKRTNYKSQLHKFRALISLCAKQYLELLNSSYLLKSEKKVFSQYVDETIKFEELEDALFNLTYYLQKHFQKKVILLIDEYDVPLQSAHLFGYYDEMVAFFKNVFSSVLKTNDALEKGIMTGCLRISKESIFTGLNNFNVYSILDYKNNEYFGFNEIEIKKLLSDYNLSNYFNEVKEWYDGYLFGDKEIYNPWSTLKYIDRKLQNLKLKAISFWTNTSSNDIIYDYIKKGNNLLHEEFETLMQGKSIVKTIKPELTYRDMNKLSNIYSFLLLTGYLKIKNDKGNHQYELIIPNKEVYEIYEQSFIDYFMDYTENRKDDLYLSLINGDIEKINILLNDILSKSISYYDNQENFYHGFLVGLFSDKNIESNKEAGNGRFDLCIFPNIMIRPAIIIECKHSIKTSDLIKDANDGAKQIINKKYLTGIKNKGYKDAIGYSISFYKKQCYVVKVQE